MSALPISEQSTDRPCVDVVILTWNDGELLQPAVDSALASVGVDVRVTVVDNGSDLPPDVVGDPRLVLVPSRRNLGVAAGRNLGASMGSAPFVCFLDSDARLHPGTLSRLIGGLSADPAIALVAPVFDGQRPEASAGRAPTLTDKILRVTNRRDSYRSAPHPETGSWDVDFAIGACQLVRRDDFVAAHGFDESYFYGPEDIDLCLRLKESRHRVVQVAGAGCEHPARRRNRRLVTVRGVRHGWAVARHLWRHRGYARLMGT